MNHPARSAFARSAATRQSRYVLHEQPAQVQGTKPDKTRQLKKCKKAFVFRETNNTPWMR